MASELRRVGAFTETPDGGNPAGAFFLFLLLTLSVAARATEAPTYNILGASVWSGTAFEPRDLVVRDGGLVDPEPGIEIPSLDWSGYYLIPGLIDAHTHLFEWGLPLPDEAEGDLDSEAIRTGSQALLLSGVTSARTHLFDLSMGPEHARRAEDPCVASPTISLSGPGLFAARPELNGRQVWGATSLPDLREKLGRVAQSGAKWFAIHDVRMLGAEFRQRLPEMAAQLGLEYMVGLRTASDIAPAIALGAASLEYLPEDGPLSAALIEALSSPGAPPLVPPIGYYTRIARALRSSSPLGYLGLPDHPLRHRHEQAIRARFDDWFRGDEYNLEREQRYDSLESVFRQLLGAKVAMILGTDAGSPGQYHEIAIWNEIEAWQELGADTETVLAAVRLAAEVLGFDRAGALESGLAADFVVLKAPVLRREHVVATARSGVLYSRHGFAAGAEFEAEKWCAGRPSS